MPFEGIIPFLRDLRHRSDYDKFNEQYKDILATGTPDQIARLPVDARNRYQMGAVQNALGGQKEAGGIAYQGAQTGEVGVRTAGMRQDQGFRQREGEYAQDKFGAPTLGAANTGLESQRLGLVEKDFGLRDTAQKASFAGSRRALIADGVPAEQLTQPEDYNPVYQQGNLAQGERRLKMDEQTKTAENTRLGQLGKFIGSSGFLTMPDEQRAPYLAEYSKLMGIQQGGQVDPNAEKARRVYEEQQRAKNGQGPVVFGADTPPLNLQNPESNFNFWERAAMGAQGVPRALGLTNKPSIQEQVTGPQPTVWQRMGRFLDTRDNLPPIVPQGYENQPQPRQLPTPSALQPQRPREGQQQRNNPQPQAMIQQQQDEQQRLLMAQFIEQFMGGQRG